MGLSQNKDCYVCLEPVLKDDIPTFKDIDDNGVFRTRHFWHMIPNHDFVQGIVRYALTLNDAKTWAELKLADPYKAPAQRELFQRRLEEVDRLIALRPEPEPGLHTD